MRTYFIDLENVASSGLRGVDNLSPDDVVYIFHSKKSNTLHIDVVQDLLKSKHKLKFVELDKSGENAMDFQIVSLIGILIGRRRKGTYYIISNDNGYDSAIRFILSYLPKYDIVVDRFPSIDDSITGNKDTEKNNYSDSKIEILGDVLTNHTDKLLLDNIPDIRRCIKYSNSKTELHNKLCKTLGQSKGESIYKTLRPRLNKSHKR